MAGTIDMTESELLEALRAALASPDAGPEGAYTVRELVERLGRHEDAIRRELRKLARAGLVESVRIRAPALDGVWRPVPAYRLRLVRG